MTTFLVCEICESRHPAETMQNGRCKQCLNSPAPGPKPEPAASVIPCTYCQKLFKPKRSWQKFCCESHAEMFRRYGHGTVIGLLKQESQNLRERLACERALWQIERDGLVKEIETLRQEIQSLRNSS